MRILCGGVRGSTPCAESEKAVFGGHTTCLLVTGSGGELLMLDAGSGVRTVEPRLGAAGARGVPALHILLTHLHLDHLVGLPMLQALYRARWKVEIIGPRPAGGTLRSALDRLLAPPLWPFSLEDFPAEVTVREFGPADGVLQLGGLEIRGTPVPHPGGCTAWRIDDTGTGTALVLATDLEWSAAGSDERHGLVALCRQPRPVDLLIMDGHFAPEEMADHAGWGHSSTAECVAAARLGGAARLLVTHHAPDNDDERLEAMARQMRGLWAGADLARQGMDIHLDRPIGKDSTT